MLFARFFARWRPVRFRLSAIVTVLACLSLSPAHGQEDVGVMLSQTRLILTNLPSSGERADRLRGVVKTMQTPEPFLRALPGIVNGAPIPIAASLAAYDRLGGNEQQRRYDVWFKGQAELADPDRTGILSGGMDYLVTDGLLLGGFTQANSPATLARTNWSFGGFGTARVAEGVNLDFMGARTIGLGNASGWLATSSLSGQWNVQDWTFSPQARFSYVSAYADNGAVDAAQSRATAELAVGPSVSYKLTTVSNVVITTGIKLDTTASASRDNWDEFALDGVRSGLGGTLNIDLPTGARWKSSIGYQGIGEGTQRFNATGSLMVPLR